MISLPIGFRPYSSLRERSPVASLRRPGRGTSPPTGTGPRPPGCRSGDGQQHTARRPPDQGNPARSKEKGPRGDNDARQAAYEASEQSLINRFEDENPHDEAVQRSKALEGADLAEPLRDRHELRVDDPHHADKQRQNGQPAILLAAPELPVDHFMAAGKDLLSHRGVNMRPDGVQDFVARPDVGHKGNGEGEGSCRDEDRERRTIIELKEILKTWPNGRTTWRSTDLDMFLRLLCGKSPPASGERRQHDHSYSS